MFHVCTCDVVIWFTCHELIGTKLTNLSSRDYSKETPKQCTKKYDHPLFIKKLLWWIKSDDTVDRRLSECQ